MCSLCTRINGGRMHYMQLFGLKASSVQRYFLLDNLILCFRYSGITNQFWRLQLKANFLKVPRNIIAIAELNSPTREICRPTTSQLMMQQLELHLEEATEMEISQTPRFCLINACFVKSQSTSQTRRPERSFTVCSMKKKACAFLHVK